MAANYASLAFSDASKALQEKHGSRKNYARMEKQSIYDGLSEGEIAFISERDSFYIATQGVNGYPYVQFRGGPKGFLKVIDSHTLGMLDYRGNMQYVTAGNLATHDKAAIILLDYPTRTRLKLYARAEILELNENPQLVEKLKDDYPAKVERILLLHVEAYDWNCPQHITPRYTLPDIQEAFAPMQQELERLKQENQRVREQLAAR